METEKKMLLTVVLCMTLYMLFMYKNVNDFKSCLVKDNKSMHANMVDMNKKFQNQMVDKVDKNNETKDESEDES